MTTAYFLELRRYCEEGKDMLHNEYMYNKRFRDYVDKYCRVYGYTLEEAFTHEQVRRAYLHYTEV